MSKAVVTCLRQKLGVRPSKIGRISLRAFEEKNYKHPFFLPRLSTLLPISAPPFSRNFNKRSGRLFQDRLLGFDGRDSLLSSCRMWTSQLSLIHPFPLPSPTNVLDSCSISQATSSIRNSFSGTFDIVIINPSIKLLFSTEIMRQHDLKLTKD